MTNKTLDKIVTKFQSISPIDAYVASGTIAAAAVAGTEAMKSGNPYLSSALIGLPVFAQMIAGAGRELANSNRNLNSRAYKNLSSKEKSAIHSADIMYGFAKWGAIGCAEALAGYYLVAPLLEKIL